MDIKRMYSRRCFLWVFIVMLLLSAFLGFFGYMGRRYLFSVLPLSVLQAAADQIPDFKAGLDRLVVPARYLNDYFVFMISGLCFMFGLLLWGILQRSFARLMKGSGIITEARGRIKKKGGTEKAGAEKALKAEGAHPIEKQAAMEANSRFYLHLLSVLQREGRLVDFFAEDLSQYEDAQIGAAVRSIHENCRKALQKSIKPGAVIDKKEGEEVVVPSGFDAGEIRLIGNVSGEPPFKGVLRHRGWRAGRVDLPTLTPGRDSMVIAPAEVEIL